MRSALTWSAVKVHVAHVARAAEGEYFGGAGAEDFGHPVIEAVAVVDVLGEVAEDGRESRKEREMKRKKELCPPKFTLQIRIF
ncbi:uncharacterized protein A4U43_C07F8850 [Asparagus officinalis]|uniref:Uncharacterized protein n=1 Tax=Asparagus officinalis TaxID=4686 RepID=A0A5P1EAD8_ASPOF|nr:uncharacterized protein A4U43_C07F8850 [Asparagus officinalis]